VWVQEWIPSTGIYQHCKPPPHTHTLVSIPHTPPSYFSPNFVPSCIKPLRILPALRTKRLLAVFLQIASSGRPWARWHASYGSYPCRGRSYLSRGGWGIDRPTNPLSGLRKGLFSGISEVVVALGGLGIKPYRGWVRGGAAGAARGELAAIYALAASPVNAIAAFLEALALGLRFADVSPRERRYDELAGLGDGLLQGLTSAYYGSWYGFYRFGQLFTQHGRHQVMRRHAYNAQGWCLVLWQAADATLVCVGVVTHPVGGVLDLLGKTLAGLLVALRARSLRRHGRRNKTARRHSELLHEYERLMLNHLHKG